MQLLNTGSSPQDLLQAGLSIKTERGLMLDRFRGRIMFPIHNHMGKVVGFTGRILPQLDRLAGARITAKYVNSPETPIFQKSKLLYGFWKSKDAIREAKTAVLVEGQMDFLMSWQSGVKNVIASSGTAFTADHLAVLHRLADEIIISFDSDPAGAEAAERAIDLAEASDFSVKVATFKDSRMRPTRRRRIRRTSTDDRRRGAGARVLFQKISCPKDPMPQLKTREGLQQTPRRACEIEEHRESGGARISGSRSLPSARASPRRHLKRKQRKANRVGSRSRLHKEEEVPKREDRRGRS